MVWVMVAWMLPVEVGLAVSLYCWIIASSAALLDDPTCEKATVLPFRSSILRTGESARTYQ